MELREVFRSLGDWQRWSAQHRDMGSPDALPPALAAIRSEGLTEPLTGRHYAPTEVAIQGGNFRESVRAGNLISRQRALVAELCRQAELGRPHLVTPQARIFALEAQSPLALFLRGVFPRFLGAEAVHPGGERPDLFPIPAEDPHGLALPDASFDLVLSSDALQCAQGIEGALRESCRILRDGGLLLATFPFRHRRQETASAEQPAGDGTAQTDPAVPSAAPAHPPAQPRVFQVPAWDIIEHAKDAGFSDAYFVYHVSAKHGILGSDTSGVFVFCAEKARLKHALASDAESPETHPAQLTQPVPGVSRVLGILGLPRSGTTVLAAVLGAHSRISMTFEPWNAEKNDLPPLDLDYRGFIDRFKVELGGRDILAVKETATFLRYVTAVENLLRISAAERPVGFIWIYRDPIHVYLSEMEARKNWWGQPDTAVTADSFDRWVQRSLPAIKRVFALFRSIPSAVCISYEGFAARPEEATRKLMDAIGVPMEPGQLSFHEKPQDMTIRGDMGLAKAPKQVSAESLARRQRQQENLAEQLSASPHFPAVRRLAELAVQLADQCVVDASSPWSAELDRLLSSLHLPVVPPAAKA